MHHAGFNFKEQQLYCENVACTQIAHDIGTPCYVYSRQQITNQYLTLEKNIKINKKIFYAVKANSNLAILKLLKDLGSGFDVVSIGEMQRVLHIGASPQDIVFSGVGKSKEELEFAIKQNIHGIHVESASELNAIIALTSSLQLTANIAIRINPDINVATHPYISTGLRNNKFGVTLHTAMELYALAAKNKFINIVGITCHLGSQIQSIEPYMLAIDILLQAIQQLKTLGITINYMDIGGGMGIAYDENDLIFDIALFTQELNKIMAQYQNLTLHIEPGRFIVGNAGALLTTAQYIKNTDAKKFLIIDAAMNDLIRPCLYHSVHAVVNTKHSANETEIFDIVGPICESADFIAKDYPLSAQEGDLLAIKDCGAYAASMASNYNTRPRAPEILVSGDTYSVVRRREIVEDLFELEVF
jgi:diaminopimelate decarboxylase